MENKNSRKTYRHSTLSRRDFMKMLGLGSVGMGAAALGLSPEMPFADLDDMMLRLRDHLEHCPHCKEEFDALLEAVRSLE